jgi:hypothetical protein
VVDPIGLVSLHRQPAPGASISEEHATFQTATWRPAGLAMPTTHSPPVAKKRRRQGCEVVPDPGRGERPQGFEQTRCRRRFGRKETRLAEVHKRLQRSGGDSMISRRGERGPIARAPPIIAGDRLVYRPEIEARLSNDLWPTAACHAARRATGSHSQRPVSPQLLARGDLGESRRPEGGLASSDRSVLPQNGEKSSSHLDPPRPMVFATGRCV